MTLFNSVIYALGTAGTGGFAVDATSLAAYGSYSQYVIAIFMIIFGINFTMFYMLIIGNWKEVVKNEELKVFFIVVLLSISLIVINIFSLYSTFEEAFRHSLFQVASIISTSGFATTDFNLWPTMSKIIILVIMIFGGCAGSTAGGMKMSRIIILFKSSFRRIKSMISPRKVQNIKLNKETIDNETVEGVQNFLIVYVIVFIAVALLISIDGKDLITTFTASLTCISNVGPGFGAVGPMGSFAEFSDFSKILLSIEMIAGRLEIFPILIMFYPKTWIKR
jgi:trk system potassium uptake protein TrkH